MRERVSRTALHGYVDGCLSDAERRAFEACLCEDKELSTQVETWRAQRDALRVAFGASEPEPSSAAPMPVKARKPRLTVDSRDALAPRRSTFEDSRTPHAHPRNQPWVAARKLAALGLLTIVFLILASGST